MLRHPARARSRRIDRSISHVSLLYLLWPLYHQFSLSFPSRFLCPSHHTASLLSFPASFPSLFLSLPSCQNQLRSRHLWKHSEALQLELIITSSVPTVIVFPPHCSTYCILSSITAVSISISLGLQGLHTPTP